MKSYVLAAAAALCLAGTAQASQIEGSYSLEGATPAGTPYTGYANIMSTGPDTCEVRWEISAEVSVGNCIQTGNLLSVATVGADNRSMVMVFELKDDKSLEGTYVVYGSGGVGHETLTPKN